MLPRLAHAASSLLRLLRCCHVRGLVIPGVPLTGLFFCGLSVHTLSAVCGSVAISDGGSFRGLPGDLGAPPTLVALAGRSGAGGSKDANSSYRADFAASFLVSCGAVGSAA